MLTDLHQLSRIVRSTLERRASLFYRQSTYLRLKQTLAVSLVAALILTTPDSTGWAAQQNQQLKNSTSVSTIVQTGGQLANTLLGFVTGTAFRKGPDGTLQPIYSNIMDGYNENGMAGGLDTYVANFATGQLGQAANVYASGSTLGQEMALESAMAANKPGVVYQLSNGSIVSADASPVQWQQVSNIPEIRGQLQKIDKQITSANEQATGQILGLDDYAFQTEWNATLSGMGSTENQVAQDLQGVKQSLQAASLGITNNLGGMDIGKSLQMAKVYLDQVHGNRQQLEKMEKTLEKLLKDQEDRIQKTKALANQLEPGDSKIQKAIEGQEKLAQDLQETLKKVQDGMAKLDQAIAESNKQYELVLAGTPIVASDTPTFWEFTKAFARGGWHFGTSAVVSAIGPTDISGMSDGWQQMSDAYNNYFNHDVYVAKQNLDKPTANKDYLQSGLSGIDPNMSPAGQDSFTKWAARMAKISATQQAEIQAMLENGELAKAADRLHSIAAANRNSLSSILQSRADLKSMANGGPISGDPRAITQAISNAYGNMQARVQAEQKTNPLNIIQNAYLSQMRDLLGGPGGMGFDKSLLKGDNFLSNLAVINDPRYTGLQSYMSYYDKYGQAVSAYDQAQEVYMSALFNSVKNQSAASEFYGNISGTFGNGLGVVLGAGRMLWDQAKLNIGDGLSQVGAQMNEWSPGWGTSLEQSGQDIKIASMNNLAANSFVGILGGLKAGIYDASNFVVGKFIGDENMVFNAKSDLQNSVWDGTAGDLFQRGHSASQLAGYGDTFRTAEGKWVQLDGTLASDVTQNILEGQYQTQLDQQLYRSDISRGYQDFTRYMRPDFGKTSIDDPMSLVHDLPLQANSLMSNITFDSLERSWVDAANGPIDTLLRGMVVGGDKLITTTAEMLPVSLLTGFLGTAAAGEGVLANVAGVANDLNKALSVGMQFHFVEGMANNVHSIASANSFGDVVYYSANTIGTAAGMGLSGYVGGLASASENAPAPNFLRSMTQEGVNLGLQITGTVVGQQLGIGSLAGFGLGYGGTMGLHTVYQTAGSEAQAAIQFQSALDRLGDSSAPNPVLEGIVRGTLAGSLGGMSSSEIEALGNAKSLDIGPSSMLSWLSGAKGTSIDISEGTIGRQVLNSVLTGGQLESTAIRDAFASNPVEALNQLRQATDSAATALANTDTTNPIYEARLKTYNDALQSEQQAVNTLTQYSGLAIAAAGGNVKAMTETLQSLPERNVVLNLQQTVADAAAKYQIEYAKGEAADGITLLDAKATMLEAEAKIAVLQADGTSSLAKAEVALRTSEAAFKAQADLNRLQAEKVGGSEALLHKTDASYYDALAHLAEVKLRSDPAQILAAQQEVDLAKGDAKIARASVALTLAKSDFAAAISAADRASTANLLDLAKANYELVTAQKHLLSNSEDAILQKSLSDAQQSIGLSGSKAQMLQAQADATNRLSDVMQKVEPFKEAISRIQEIQKEATQVLDRVEKTQAAGQAVDASEVAHLTDLHQQARNAMSTAYGREVSAPAVEPLAIEASLQGMETQLETDMSQMLNPVRARAEASQLEVQRVNASLADGGITGRLVENLKSGIARTIVEIGLGDRFTQTPVTTDAEIISRVNEKSPADNPLSISDYVNLNRLNREGLQSIGSSRDTFKPLSSYEAEAIYQKTSDALKGINFTEALGNRNLINVIAPKIEGGVPLLEVSTEFSGQIRNILAETGALHPDIIGDVMRALYNQIGDQMASRPEMQAYAKYFSEFKWNDVQTADTVKLMLAGQNIEAAVSGGKSYLAERTSLTRLLTDPERGAATILVRSETAIGQYFDAKYQNLAHLFGVDIVNLDVLAKNGEWDKFVKAMENPNAITVATWSEMPQALNEAMDSSSPETRAKLRDFFAREILRNRITIIDEAHEFVADNLEAIRGDNGVPISTFKEHYTALLNKIESLTQEGKIAEAGLGGSLTFSRDGDNIIPSAELRNELSRYSYADIKGALKAVLEDGDNLYKTVNVSNAGVVAPRSDMSGIQPQRILHDKAYLTTKAILFERAGRTIDWEATRAGGKILAAASPFDLLKSLGGQTSFLSGTMRQYGRLIKALTGGDIKIAGDVAPSLRVSADGKGIEIFGENKQNTTVTPVVSEKSSEAFSALVRESGNTLLDRLIREQNLGENSDGLGQYIGLSNVNVKAVAFADAQASDLADRILNGNEFTTKVDGKDSTYKISTLLGIDPAQFNGVEALRVAIAEKLNSRYHVIDDNTVQDPNVVTNARNAVKQGSIVLTGPVGWVGVDVQGKDVRLMAQGIETSAHSMVEQLIARINRLNGEVYNQGGDATLFLTHDELNQIVNDYLGKYGADATRLWKVEHPEELKLLEEFKKNPEKVQAVQKFFLALRMNETAGISEGYKVAADRIYNGSFVKDPSKQFLTYLDEKYTQESPVYKEAFSIYQSKVLDHGSDLYQEHVVADRASPDEILKSKFEGVYQRVLALERMVANNKILKTELSKFRQVFRVNDLQVIAEDYISTTVSDSEMSIHTAQNPADIVSMVRSFADHMLSGLSTTHYAPESLSLMLAAQEKVEAGGVVSDQEIGKIRNAASHDLMTMYRLRVSVPESIIAMANSDINTVRSVVLANVQPSPYLGNSLLGSDLNIKAKQPIGSVKSGFVQSYQEARDQGLSRWTSARSGYGKVMTTRSSSLSPEVGFQTSLDSLIQSEINVTQQISLGKSASGLTESLGIHFANLLNIADVDSQLVASALTSAKISQLAFKASRSIKNATARASVQQQVTQDLYRIRLAAQIRMLKNSDIATAQSGEKAGDAVTVTFKKVNKEAHKIVTEFSRASREAKTSVIFRVAPSIASESKTMDLIAQLKGLIPTANLHGSKLSFETESAKAGLEIKAKSVNETPKDVIRSLGKPSSPALPKFSNTGRTATSEQTTLVIGELVALGAAATVVLQVTAGLPLLVAATAGLGIVSFGYYLWSRATQFSLSRAPEPTLQAVPVRRHDSNDKPFYLDPQIQRVEPLKEGPVPADVMARVRNNSAEGDLTPFPSASILDHVRNSLASLRSSRRLETVLGLAAAAIGIGAANNGSLWLTLASVVFIVGGLVGIAKIVQSTKRASPDPKTKLYFGTQM